MTLKEWFEREQARTKSMSLATLARLIGLNDPSAAYRLIQAHNPRVDLVYRLHLVTKGEVTFQDYWSQATREYVEGAKSLEAVRKH